MSRLLVVLLGLAAVALALQPSRFGVLTSSRAMFDSFALRYGKTYASENERTKRFEIFVANVAYINAFNAAGNATYTLGINQFADLTNAEFRAMMNGYKVNPNRTRNEIAAKDIPASPEVTCPTNGMYTCDWRQAGVVTPIKNQGQCGSCWAFSAVASTEGAHALATKSLVSLSEQNLVDCSQKEGNQGCNGGLMDQAFEYIIKNEGIDTEASYPYKAVQGACKFNKGNVGATLTSFKDLPKGNEATLAQACASVGPISVAIDASHNSFQFYQTGVYYEPACSTTQLDHGVLVVGYGNDSGSDYWIVKNSWGTTWGQQGYIWMSRNRNNNCGIATQASYPIAGSSTAASNSGPAASNSGPAASGPAASNSGPAASGPAASHSGPASNSGPSNSGPAASHTTSASASSGKTQSSSGKTQSSSGQASSGSSGNSSGSSNNSSGSSGASSGASSGSSGQGSSASSGSKAPRRLVDA